MESTPKKQISTKEILARLREGKTRAEIKEEFKLTHAEMKTLFSTPSLKGRRTHTSKSQIEIIDDAGEPDEEENPDATQADEANPANEVVLVQEEVLAPAPQAEPVKEVQAEEIAHKETGEVEAPSATTSSSENPVATAYGEVEEKSIRFEDAWAMTATKAEPETLVAEEVLEDRAPFDRAGA